MLVEASASGLPVIAVSNSDGTAERSLERAGLRDLFRAVVDSHLVGAEKPDPAIFRAASASSRTVRRSGRTSLIPMRWWCASAERRSFRAVDSCAGTGRS